MSPQSLSDKLHQSLVAVACFLASLHQQTIGTGYGETGHLRQSIGSRLEDHHQHSDGNSLLNYLQCV